MASKRSCLQRLSRRLLRHLGRQLHRYALLLLMGLAALWAITAWGERTANRLAITRHHLPQSVLPGAGPLRIALISDIHDNRQLLRRCVEQVEKERPDLIVLGGDLVMVSKRFKRTRGMVELLRRLQAVAPTYAVLGNHDYEMQAQVERVLATAGVRLLRNEALDRQTPSGHPLRLVGLGDWNEGDECPAACLPPRGQEGAPILLLSHDPESRHLLQDYGWQLMLSGHTHGGQLGNPFTGRAICLRSDMPAGHYAENGRHHVVSRGVGSIMGMRFFSKPELVFISVGEE